jgi:hypothetical protein
MRTERGAALILALLILLFLAVLAGGLLTSTTLDIWVGDNYRVGAQLLYLAEAGIEDGREALRMAMTPPSQLLATAAGADGVLSTSRDLPTLLNSTDDIAFVNGGDRLTGKPLTDSTGRIAGRYYVFLRNDVGDGLANLSDTNQTLTLLTFGVIGSATRILETTVLKFKFPNLPAALTLDGSPATFQPLNSDAFGISGVDVASNRHESAIGVIATSDQNAVLQAIPAGRQLDYAGNLQPNPPPADVAVIDGNIDPRLKNPLGLESIVASIASDATDIFNPAWDQDAFIGGIGAPASPRIVAVNGNCTFGPGAGFGILVVRGNLTIRGNFSWTGLVLVVGQGSMHWVTDAIGQVSGGVFIARTRNTDRSVTNPLGTVLGSRGAVTAVFDGGSVNAIQLSTANVNWANSPFPYSTIAYREF